jgi:hypothetical protein
VLLRDGIRRLPVKRPGRTRGQALAELALVFPIFALVLFGIISLGLWVFYQQQLSNAAREAARYAAIHSSSAQCPTVSDIDPQAPPTSYYRCDRPEDGWPNMVGAGRAAVWGMSPDTVSIVACWSGYVDVNGNDAPPGVPGAALHILDLGRHGRDVRGRLPCPVGPPIRPTPRHLYANGTLPARVTAYACFNWRRRWRFLSSPNVTIGRRPRSCSGSSEGVVERRHVSTVGSSSSSSVHSSCCSRLPLVVDLGCVF